MSYTKDKNAAMLRVRLSDSDVKKLDDLANQFNISKSEVVRFLITNSWGALSYETKKCV